MCHHRVFLILYTISSSRLPSLLIIYPEYLKSFNFHFNLFPSMCNIASIYHWYFHNFRLATVYCQSEIFLYVACSKFIVLLQFCRAFTCNYAIIRIVQVFFQGERVCSAFSLKFRCIYIYTCACVCVCVWGRVRERDMNRRMTRSVGRRCRNKYLYII